MVTHEPRSIGREVMWDSRWRRTSADVSLVLKRLPGARRLVWGCSEYDDDTWSMMHDALQAIQDHPVEPSSFLSYSRLYKPLREMCLDACGALSDETAQGNKAFLGRRLSLRSLVLEHADVLQTWAEDLLKDAPDLKELKLVSLLCREHKWNWSQFANCVQSLPMVLRQFHYSEYIEAAYNAVLDETDYTIYPRSNEQTLWHYSLTQSAIKSLNELPIVLTTLNILWSNYQNCYADGWTLSVSSDGFLYSAQQLHRLLCECAGLRHLRPLKAPYLLGHRDLFHRIGLNRTRRVGNLYPDSPAVLIQPGIWICRELESLHIQLHSYGPGILGGHRYVRIAFGYISRVCPRLVNLHVEPPIICTTELRVLYRTNWTCDFDDGLCLMSSLEHLEELQVVYAWDWESGVDCELSEMNWMCASGQTAEHGMGRREVVKGWGGQLEKEAAMDKEHQRVKGEGGSSIIRIRPEDVALMSEIKDLGLLQDVKTMAERMDAEDFGCLPRLRLLSLGCHRKRKPEVELRSLFNPTE
ncbi:MAG: hypothetical protein J3R72DRAFT_487325 [Linnemannia gamsii]|nr:MAG: hypothetical protein J3R72DRAFT_487325 [Linnemannia gamsii]